MENNENNSFENEEELQETSDFDANGEKAESAEDTEGAVNTDNEITDSEDPFAKQEEAPQSAVFDNGFGAMSESAAETSGSSKKNGGIIAVISIVGVLILAAIISLCYNFFGKVPTDGSAVIFEVDGQKITEDDFRYFMVGEAYTLQYTKLLEQVNQLSSDVGTDAIDNLMREYSWDTVDEETGKTYTEIAKENALNAAIKQVVSVKKAEELGITLSDEEKTELEEYAENNRTQYGDDYEEVLLANGLKSHEQSIKVFTNSQIIGDLSRKFSEDPSALGISDLSELNGYEGEDTASVKHILLVTTDEETGESMSDEQKAEVKAKAEEILARAKAGEDFNALMSEFNQDPGETEDGYTFGKGEMVEEFETASFNLKIGEISDLVESSYGYHIIQRIAGISELQTKWIQEADVKVNQKALNAIPVQKDEENAFKVQE